MISYVEYADEEVTKMEDKSKQGERKREMLELSGILTSIEKQKHKAFYFSACLSKSLSNYVKRQTRYKRMK